MSPRRMALALMGLPLMGLPLVGAASAAPTIDPSLSVGGALRTNRARPVEARGGFVVEAQAPLAWRVGLRLDAGSPWQTDDQLRAQGWTTAVMAVYDQPLVSIYGLDAAIGPSLWWGPSGWWAETVRGPFPGLRAAVAATVRPLPYLGGRIELGTDHHWGTHELVDGSSHGADLRVLITGLVPLRR